MNTNDNLFNYIKVDENNKNENDVEVEKQPYKNRIKELNLMLNINGFTEIGDLFDPSFYSVNKTLNVIRILLDDRQKILESKTEVNKKLSKSEEDYINVLEKSEISNSKMQELNKKIGSLRNKIAVDEKKFKEEIEKFKNEKNEMEKTLNRMSMKEAQFKHEIRKLEKEIEECKNRLKKNFNEKESNVISNSFKTQISNNANLKCSNNSIKSVNITNEQSQNLKPPLSFNSIIPDSESKNSSKILHNVEHLREFYNLIFNSMNDKMNQLINQNSDMKQCYKLIYDELNQFIEYKKIFLYKISQDTLNIKDIHTIIDFKIFELDFNLARESVLQNFNEILNTFRFMLVYEIMKVDPNDEFDFEDIKKMISNKKFRLEEIPYYAELTKKIESYNFKKLFELKTEMNKFISSQKEIPKAGRKHSKVIKDNKSVLGKSEININDNIRDSTKNKNCNDKNDLNILENLEDTNTEIVASLNMLDDKFSYLQNEISKANENLRLKNK